MPGEIGIMPLSAAGQEANRNLYAEWEAFAQQAEAEAAETAGEAAAEEAVLDAAIATGTASFAAGAAAVVVVLAISAAAFVIAKKISDDNGKRGAYTENFADTASQKYPHYNVVICHPNHTVSPAPGKGSYVIHQHVELGMTVGTCGYDIYFSRKGKAFKFVNQGDGGFINWAFNGEFTRNGGTLTASQHA